jgi:hypothetical protein
MHYSARKLLIAAIFFSRICSASGEIASVTHIPAKYALYDVLWTEFQFIGIGSDSAVHISTNGTEWNKVFTATSGPFNGIAGNSYRTMAVGIQKVIHSVNNSGTWFQNNLGSPYQLFDIAWSGSQFVLVGADGRVVTSIDGTGWTSRNSGTAGTLTAIAKTGSTVTAVSDLDSIFESADHGVTWTSHYTGTGNMQAITASASVRVAVGSSGRIISSADGLSWTRRTSNTTASLNTVAWSGRNFIAAGARGIILSSTNGTDWSTDTSLTGVVFYCSAVKGDTVLLCGYSTTDTSLVIAKYTEQSVGINNSIAEDFSNTVSYTYTNSGNKLILRFAPAINNSETRYSISTLSGKELISHRMSMGQNTAIISLKGLASGIYMTKAETNRRTKISSLIKY